ncbi:IS91 family transposase [Sinorhizobium sp. BJ1]|uniref:IS91 family transposase n=1 Tax=Sinorhizobium sp. BJ1 TaxID=2035455 RepID=UPI000BEA17FE|nr:IS91 family transposase [Sinorhizobium sp. BJ1]PDT82317.1 IS91 family transposase [Sinorhizobium sp. BJ1]
MRPALEVADIFRRHGPAYRRTHDGHLGRGERRVMAAIALCRTAALGGHVETCDDCALSRVAYNSCRNRHCPKCQGAARDRWLADRQADLLPVPYFHVVFTVPAEIAAIAYQNKRQLYTILFEAAAETLKTIAADPRHLGGELGFLAILHTWGQTLTHHPHLHCLVPGGVLAADRRRWVACRRRRFFLPVRVLSRLFRRLFLERLQAAQTAGGLRFFGALAPLGDGNALARALRPLRKKRWVVYAKPPFGSPERVLAYLGRYTHRVAIANSRLVSADATGVTFRWRDYRHGNAPRSMTLAPHEFIRRFLLHCLPDGFHRIRHYGFLANGIRRARLAVIRRLLADAPPERSRAESCQRGPFDPTVCPCCGGILRITVRLPRARPRPDTS